jgi:hypothetical protein
MNPDAPVISAVLFFVVLNHLPLCDYAGATFSPWVSKRHSLITKRCRPDACLHSVNNRSKARRCGGRRIA